ncbi:MAG TPA: M36 family metallopeptidase, partial [Labilithrix sp.]|nr:M36 family metallopeptidase [Labilithrix sp.]
DRREAERSVAPPSSPGGALHPFVAHRDPRDGAGNAPTFVWLAKKDEAFRFATAQEAATATLQSLRTTFALDDRALASVASLTVDASSVGPVIARFRQRDPARGIEVFRGGLAIAMTRSFDPVSASGLLAPSLAGAERPFVRSAADAVNDAYAALDRGELAFTSAGPPDGDYQHFTGAGLAAPARVKKVLFPQGAGVVPAYYVELQIARGPALSFVVSAGDGHVLLTNDLVRHDAFGYRVYADPATRIPLDGPQGNAAAPHPTGQPSGFKPKLGGMSLVTLQNYPFSKNDPWLAADATTTLGNNVRAYADRNAPDGLGGDDYLAVSGPKLFDYAYDTTQSPGTTATNVGGSVAHLFYVTNFLHDWYYDLGYDEASGNHQNDNFGRGGLGRDPLKAEAQDYDGRNNANATVPADGSSPRLQMYVFSGPSVSSITVEAPAAIAGIKATEIAGFGTDAFDLSGPVALATDDQGVDPFDGCEAISTNLTGKIALVHRGLCSFIQKVQNAQAAGAIGCIVTNVAGSADPNTPPFMGGTTAAVTIPVLSLALADGKALEASLAGGATVHLHRELATDLDGSLDTTVVAHEWGHVISGRLVGDGAGLTTNQAGGLGEGWGDFSGLLLMVREDDVRSATGAGWKGAYPNGGYATSGGGADFYYGIRRVPYSTDLTKDPLTFQHIQNGSPLPPDVPVAFGEDGSFNAEVHNTGEVWATMLWECYAALLRDSRYSFTEAQTRMRRYYVASLKLTPPDPTLLEARDAVLAAALASDEGDYRLFWGAFARRGAGVGAEGPPKSSTTNQGVVESYSVDNDVQISAGTLTDDVITCDHDGLLDDGEIGTFSFAVRNAGPGVLLAPTATLSSPLPGVGFPDGGTVKLEALKPFGKAASVKIHVQLQGVAARATLPLVVNVTDPSFAAGHVAQIELSARAHVDEAPDSSAIDLVDTKSTSWVVAADDTSEEPIKWSRVSSSGAGYWTVPDPFQVADHYLTSPPFTIEGTTFELSFKHRWSFRRSARRMVDVDGGVVEVSVDGGKTWRDVAELGTADYNTTIDTGGRGDNPLKGRRAYGNRSEGYPEAWVTSRLKLDVKKPPASVRVRFHVGAGTGFSGAPGWDVADIALGGITSTPFWSFIDHADACDPNAPVANAGPPMTVRSGLPFTIIGSGTHPADLPLAFAWSQLAGPAALRFAADGSPRADFLAPDVAKPTPLTFELRVNDGALLSPGSRVEVTVIPQDTSAGDSGCSTSRRSPARGSAAALVVSAALVSLLLIGLVARRRQRASR